MRRKFKRYLPLYLLALPGMLYFLIFRYLPMGGIVLAFKKLDLTKGLFGSPWADPFYSNFKKFFDSPYFFSLLSNTLYISLLKLIFMTAAAIFMAIIINEIGNTKFKRLTQTITYMPHFLSWVTIYGILFLFFSEVDGVVNLVIKALGGDSINILSNEKVFRALAVISDMWKETGFSAIIYLAAITGIDLSQYEAAKVDGASKIKIIYYITLPNLLGIVVIMGLLHLGQIMDAGFEQIYILQNTRVISVAEILDTYTYKVGLQQMMLEYASAIGLFKSLIATVLVISMNRLAKRSGNALW